MRIMMVSGLAAMAVLGLLAGCGSAPAVVAPTPVPTVNPLYAPPPEVVIGGHRIFSSFDPATPALAEAVIAEARRAGVGNGSDPNAMFARPAFDASRMVDSAAALQKAANEAVPGSVLVLKNGTYRDLVVTVPAERDGTPDKPIVVMAETPGKVILEGASAINIDADYVVIEGMRFANGKPGHPYGAIVLYGSHNRVTNCEIIKYNPVTPATDNRWLSIRQSQHNRVDHCTFASKASQGALFIVWRDNAQKNYHRVDHNVFREFAYSIDVLGGSERNGWETIRLGTSDHSQSDSCTLIEYNHFFKCDGEGEIISVKSGANVVQYNTFLESKGQISLRHGKNCVVQYNFIRGNGVEMSGGIGLMDSGHLVVSNYIEGIQPKAGTRYNGGILLLAAFVNPQLNTYWLVDQVTVKGNTVVNSYLPLAYGAGGISSSKPFDYDQRPDRVTFEANLVQNGVGGHASSSRQLITLVNRDERGGWDIQRPVYKDNWFGGAALGLDAVPVGVNTTPAQMVKLEGTGQWVWNGPGGPGAVGAPAIPYLSVSDVGARY